MLKLRSKEINDISDTEYIQHIEYKGVLLAQTLEWKFNKWTEGNSINELESGTEIVYPTESTETFLMVF